MATGDDVPTRALHDWPHPAWCDWRNCHVDETYGDGLTLVGHSSILLNADGWIVELHATDLCKDAARVQTGRVMISVMHEGIERVVDIPTATQLATALIQALAASVEPSRT